MFHKIALAAFLIIMPALLARADVDPSEPGPGTVFNEGSTCHTTWIGDKDSATAWKNMSIELMTGSNFDMKHLTTVATNLDGTVSGTFDFTCPQVTPNSAIYFFQFTGPNTPNKQWTTRFAIASTSGQTTPPSNPTQPGTGEAIPWGTGALVDPSTAVPPPAYLGTSGSTSSSSTNLTNGTTTSTSSSSVPPIAATSSIAPVSSSSVSSASVTPLGGSSSKSGTSTATGASASGSGAANNGARTACHSAAGVLFAVPALVYMALF